MCVLVCRYTALPQLISRLAHPNPFAQRFIKEVLVTVLLSYPLQAIWSIGPVVKSKDRERKQLVKAVIEEVDAALKRSSDKKAGLQVDSANETLRSPRWRL